VQCPPIGVSGWHRESEGNAHGDAHPTWNGVG
jgi:hypothetical protein